jgi:carbamoyltransferase
LGNRSLVFDPTFEDGKDFVNMIKHREYFRPFAGSILEEDVHEWFDLRGMDSSPTMMYAVHCKDGVAEKIPSIIHIDGSCRIQTVTREQNLHYYDIIKTFKARKGVPMVFNTSFNLGGEPLVETLEDAMWTLQQSELEYLYLPEYGMMITIKNK